ncbi:hypothetical protein V501_03178 [Pseudogymnoascus sp. VKM F-4519 (FW-2642)]|nr:hypothetical protein V501_03178 [Pseudogymnoascus sp. VKM F-4519 (FW-2642)]
MEGQSNKGQSQHQYHSSQWSRLVRRNTLAISAAPPPLSPATLIQPSPQLSTTIETFPDLLPQQTSSYQAQLAQYNKLITSGRATRVQSSPLPPLLSTQHIQAVPRSGTTSGYENRQRRRSTSRLGHGNKKPSITGNGERPLIAEQSLATMGPKKADAPKPQLSRPQPQHQHSALTQQSSSVPTTPHQRARKFSTASREPSPIPAPSHSPRSAYSETSSAYPTYRSLPSKWVRCTHETGMAHSRRRMPYSLGSERLDQPKQSSIKAKLSPDEDKKLTADMEKLYAELLPTDESEAKRQRFVQKLEHLLNTEWPGHDIKVHVFGSSGNLLCTDESDVDICITTEWKELERVCMLADLLYRNGMTKVNCVSTAKVPIVKIWDPELGLACDMNVNNTLALENTRMIKTYVQVDPRVRPLAMIIKHWTKRRILNDAAYGGTLSSYTWICMIINFLQLQEPPVLPVLHDPQHQRLPQADGHESAFADDLEALRECGKSSKQSLGELLFRFFRFYAHELDYDKHVLSVRNGKLVSKQEKGWNLANNNRLCVEEPFNVGRNLGNTADDFTFRGLHLELRRAFDLIAETKLDECCEQYVFPKEEERVWEKPTASRPVVVRSVSQSRGGGRGGGNGGRGRNTNHNRNNQGGRRASSATYDGNNGYPPLATPQGMSPSETWIQNQQAQLQLHELYMTLEAQKDNLLRLQLYSQEQNYAQGQQRMEAFAQTHRLQPNAPVTSQQAADRNRGMSFDNPPLTAPLYYYPSVSFQYPAGFGPQQGPNTYPSSPAIPSAVPELRRSLHRSNVTSGSGPGGAVSNSSARSHSTPAARTTLSPILTQYGMEGQQSYSPLHPGDITSHPPSANENGRPGFDTDSVGSRADSLPAGGFEKDYKGYGLNGSIIYQNPIESNFQSTVSASPGHRRLSTEQFPQAILERLRRTSRSPSPLGRDRGYTTGARAIPAAYGGVPHAVSNTNVRSLNELSPLIVNGSFSIPHSRASGAPSSASGSSSEDQYHDALGASVDSLYLTPQDADGRNMQLPQNSGLGVSLPPRNRSERDPSPISRQRQRPAVETHLGPPSTSNFAPSSAQSYSHATQTGAISPGTSTPAQPSSPSVRNRPSRSQGTGMSPLDLGPQKSDALRDVPHLSPVFETRSPSPTASRKTDSSAFALPPSPLRESAGSLGNAGRNPSPLANGNKGIGMPKGHTRGAKSEGGGVGTWQQIQKGKRRGQDGTGKGGNAEAEELPRFEADRKGG